MPKPRSWLRRTGSRLARVAFACSLAFALLAIPLFAFARAGGGGGYHGGGGGGGHGGGGGGGDGGGIFYLLYLLFRLCVDVPWLGIPLVLAIVAFFAYAGMKGNDVRTDSTLRRGAVAMAASAKQTAVDQLHLHDPAFGEEAFAARVRVAFEKIQAAWCAQDLRQVRAFVSDGVHERFTLQFAEQRDAGYRDHMEQLHVRSVDLADVGTTGLFDEVSVRINAWAVDYRVALADGRYVSGSKSPEPFVEVWTFLRRRGAQTSTVKPGLIEGNCPNCGAAVEMNQSANCEHCQALLRSGEYDWVLVEITQESEWQGGGRKADLPGVAALRQSDPDFDVAALEDRASVLFWRKAAADRLGKIDPLAKMASPKFCEGYAPLLRPPGGGPRSFQGDCAVGSVDTLGVYADDRAERALVEVRWAGTRFTVAPGGGGGGGGVSRGGYGLFRSLFVLARNAGVKTDVAKSISSAHCPNCGAPESQSASNACEFCNTVLNDGSRGWVLSAVLAMNEPGARDYLNRLRNSPIASHDDADDATLPLPSPASAPPPLPAQPPPSTGVLGWMVKTAAADGNVDPREREMLATLANRLRIPSEQLDRMIGAAVSGTLDVPEPADADEARQWITAMASMAMADGNLAREEGVLLRAVGARAGLGDADVRLLLNRARAEQLQTARDALRQARTPPPLPGGPR